MMLWNDDKNIMLVAGHRGARVGVPENTMPAFKYAMDLNCDMIETDIRQTKDNVLVLMHDMKVDRTTDGTGCVHEFTFDEIRKLNAAAHTEGFDYAQIPTLEELFALVAADSKMTLNLELKDYPQDPMGKDWAYATTDKTIDMVEAFHLGDRIILNSFSGHLLGYIRQKYGNKYAIHGFYPYFYLGPEKELFGSPDDYCDVCCVFNAELGEDGKIHSKPGAIADKAWFDYLLSKNIEPWLGAGVKTYEDLEKGFALGGRLVTTDDPKQTLEFLRKMGHHK